MSTHVAWFAVIPPRHGFVGADARRLHQPRDRQALQKQAHEDHAERDGDEERLEIARQNVKIQGRSLEIAEIRFKAGAVTELDVVQAKSLLRDTEASIPRFEANVRQTKNALAILLGILPGEIDGLISGKRIIPKAPPEVVVRAAGSMAPPGSRGSVPSSV